MDAATRHGEPQLIEWTGDELAQRCSGVALTFDAGLVAHGAALDGVREPRRHDGERVAGQREQLA